ncbi:hypothetical protein COR50_04100 [Chitinophaga caeni]|uniref:Uncharacterized protein n=1 Tax=Chitinophaga caeni TaxID=2029983 RepID=A0A291QR78_9BACT|nr:hypothetical protein COR50_04100 [Chitinophaga caeni]
MPANKKYLSSPGQRVLKVTAALFGGYLVSLSFHQLLMTFLDKKTVVITSFFSMYILWAILMILAFLAKNGWKIWATYILLSLLFCAPWIYEAYIK